MIHLVRKFTPRFAMKLYHRFLAWAANAWYRSPSSRMVVIGITGTSGKSTTVYLLSKMLEAAGYRVGAASTMLFKIDKREWVNDKKMTMVGRFALQRLLADMAKANCHFAIIETTSQGIEQYRHRGINYDVVLCTNLYPEHLEAHGGFENYKNAKLKLFKELQQKASKTIGGQKIKKTIIVNLDDEHAGSFIAPWAEQKLGFTLGNRSSDNAQVVRAEHIAIAGSGTTFDIDHVPFRLKLLGEHNVANALAAITVGASQGLTLPVMARALETVSGIPGRIEFIEHDLPFKVIVDYAFEPKAVEKLYEVVKAIPHQRIIHVLGSAGGGRDKARRPVLGQLAGSNAQYVIVTDEDPYDEDPQEIIDQVAAGAIAVGKVKDQDLFLILDRRQAIAQALQLAQAGDVVLITGKGSEQAIVTKQNQFIPWDDRTVVREELAKIALG